MLHGVRIRINRRVLTGLTAQKIRHCAGAQILFISQFQARDRRQRHHPRHCRFRARQAERQMSARGMAHHNRRSLLPRGKESRDHIVKRGRPTGPPVFQAGHGNPGLRQRRAKMAGMRKIVCRPPESAMDHDH